MFFQILDKISKEVEYNYESERRYARPSRNTTFYIKLDYAIRSWSDELHINQDITDYIIQGYQLDEITKITTYIWQEGIPENKTLEIPTPLGVINISFTKNNQFYQYTNALFNLMNIRNENMKGSSGFLV